MIELLVGKHVTGCGAESDILKTGQYAKGLVKGVVPVNYIHSGIKIGIYIRQGARNSSWTNPRVRAGICLKPIGVAPWKCPRSIRDANEITDWVVMTPGWIGRVIAIIKIV